jgi:hypothetical protein
VKRVAVIGGSWALRAEAAMVRERDAVLRALPRLDPSVAVMP